MENQRRVVDFHEIRNSQIPPWKLHACCVYVREPPEVDDSGVLLAVDKKRVQRVRAHLLV